MLVEELDAVVFGLCEAEMTTPRSSASSATAGVGAPASTAFPPAATTPRANASSSSGTGCAGVTAYEDLAAAGPERRRLAEPLDQVDGQILADDAADAVGAEVPAQAGIIASRTAGLAGLAGGRFLALDDAGVAGEEALALERHLATPGRPRRARGRSRDARLRPARTTTAVDADTDVERPRRSRSSAERGRASGASRAGSSPRACAR